MKYDRRTTANVVFDEIVQIFLFLIEDGKVGLLGKVVEQIQQGQTRYTDALFEYVYSTLLIEVKLSVDGLQKGEPRPCCYTRRESRATSTCYTVVAPRILTTDVVLVGNTFVLQSTEEGLLSVVERCRRASPTDPCTRTGNDLSSPRIRMLSDTWRN